MSLPFAGKFSGPTPLRDLVFLRPCVCVRRTVESPFFFSPEACLYAQLLEFSPSTLSKPYDDSPG